MGAEHEETQHLQIILFTDFTDRKEIAQGFRHFPVVNVKERIVHPVGCKGLVVGALALCDFILMVGKD